MVYRTRIEKITKKLIEENRYESLKENSVIKLGAELLKNGEVVAFPTETVYGLGADATNKDAVAKIFAAKGRPQDNPLIVHIANKVQLEEVIEGKLSQTAERLIDVFWPGPLTIIFAKSEVIPSTTTAGLNSVAVRMPSHPVARALIEIVSIPIAAPSANKSGTPSTTLAEHVLDDLNGKIPLIIDGGSSWIGVESTVIDVRPDVPIILRPGGLSREKIEEALGQRVSLAKGLKNPQAAPPSPGMKYRHYSPKTPLLIIQKLKDNINKYLQKYAGKKIALVVTKESYPYLEELADNIEVIIMGSSFKPEEIAAKLFSLLRSLDKQRFDYIFIEAIPEKELGSAVMNRLHKASSRK